MHSSRSSKPTVKRKESAGDGRVTSDVFNPIYSVIRSTSSKPTVNAKNQAKTNWTKHVDSKSGRPYWYNTITEETTWEDPFVKNHNRNTSNWA